MPYLPHHRHNKVLEEEDVGVDIAPEGPQAFMAPAPLDVFDTIPAFFFGLVARFVLDEVVLLMVVYPGHGRLDMVELSKVMAIAMHLQHRASWLHEEAVGVSCPMRVQQRPRGMIESHVIF